MAKDWSGEVTRHSNAMDLKGGVFTKSAKEIASSVYSSAKRSKRKKGTSYQSAVSMINFYRNRAGSKLSPERKSVIQSALNILRKKHGPKQ